MSDAEIAARLASKPPCTICGRQHGEPYIHEGFCQRCMRRPVMPRGRMAKTPIYCAECYQNLLVRMAAAEPASGANLRVFRGTSREV